MKDKIEFEFRETYPQETVAEHEVFMSFVNDDDALLFREWFDEIGEDLFNEWVKNNNSK